MGKSHFYLKDFCDTDFGINLAKTIDKDKWGEVASFGNSAQLHLEISPDDLPELVQAIEEELLKSPKIILPSASLLQKRA